MVGPAEVGAFEFANPSTAFRPGLGKLVIHPSYDQCHWAEHQASFTLKNVTLPVLQLQLFAFAPQKFLGFIKADGKG